jgi:hypothetical protein
MDILLGRYLEGGADAPREMLAQKISLSHRPNREIVHARRPRSIVHESGCHACATPSQGPIVTRDAILQPLHHPRSAVTRVPASAFYLHSVEFPRVPQNHVRCHILAAHRASLRRNARGVRKQQAFHWVAELALAGARCPGARCMQFVEAVGSRRSDVAAPAWRACPQADCTNRCAQRPPKSSADCSSNRASSSVRLAREAAAT